MNGLKNFFCGIIVPILSVMILPYAVNYLQNENYIINYAQQSMVNMGWIQEFCICVIWGILICIYILWEMKTRGFMAVFSLVFLMILSILQIYLVITGKLNFFRFVSDCMFFAPQSLLGIAGGLSIYKIYQKN